VPEPYRSPDWVLVPAKSGLRTEYSFTFTFTLHEHRYTVFITSCSVLHIMRTISGTSCRENQNTHFVFNNILPPSENHAGYEIEWKNIADPDRPQMTVWCLCIACWIPKSTNTHSGCVIIIALPLQQWFHKCTTMLHYMYIAHFVKFKYS